MRRKAKFLVGQVIYDVLQREYFCCDAELANLLNTGKSTPQSEGVRPLTKRERGEKSHE